MAATKFLSKDWVDALRGCAEGLDLEKADLVVSQVVKGAPDGDVHYFIGARDGTLTFGLGDPPDADVTITSGYQSAVSINKGDLDPQQAFMTGQLIVTGNMAKVIKNQDAFKGLSDLGKALEVSY